MTRRELINHMRALTIIAPLKVAYVYADHMSIYMDSKLQIAWINYLSPLGKVNADGPMCVDFKPHGITMPYSNNEQYLIECYLEGSTDVDPFAPKS